jgi:hypothetical protein
MRAPVRAHSIVAVGACAALGTILFNQYVGNRLAGPLAGPGDVSIWEYPGYYVSQNLRFRPLPHLELSTD